MKIVVIYDDTGPKSEVIADIIGKKGFADVVVRRKKLEDYYRNEIEKIYSGVVWKKIHSPFEYVGMLKELETLDSKDVKLMHCFSNYFISDVKKASLSFRKLSFIDGIYGIMDGKRAVAAMFPSVNAYAAFCKNIISGQKPRI